MSNTKYEFTGEVKVHLGVTLKRIRALMSFGVVSAGELGGWIESEASLQVYGNAWVYGNAQVSGDARVSGDAQVSGDARVYGNAWVQVGPIGSRSATLTATLDTKIGIRVTTGCFSGSLADLEAAVQATHGDSDHGQHYRLAIALIRSKLEGKS